MISRSEMNRAENWLHRYEAGGIFFARLLPVIRHLISIPAGIIRMNFGLFQSNDDSSARLSGAGFWLGLGTKLTAIDARDVTRSGGAWPRVESEIQGILIVVAVLVFCGLVYRCDAAD